MKRFCSLFTFFSLLLLLACTSEQKRQSTISLSGAFALYPMAVKWSEEYKVLHPEIRFNISAGGAGKGMADALAGTVDLGMFSREITRQELDQGVWWVGLVTDAVLPTISSGNPFLDQIKQYGMTRDDFRSIFFSTSIVTWGEAVGIRGLRQPTVYTRSDACGAAGTWAKYLGGKQENLNGIGIFSDPGLADAVSKDPLGIAYNNTIYVYDIKTGSKRPGIEVIPIDLNGNGKIDADEDFYQTFDDVLGAIGDGRYPSPPARELYFVSAGKPEKQSVLDFICWVLTEGQQFVREAGYVPITPEKLEGYRENVGCSNH